MKENSLWLDVGVVVVSILFGAVVSIGLFYNKAYGNEPNVDTETYNAQVVKESIQFCKDSKCKTCGTFVYSKYAYDTGLVSYLPSACERDYKFKLEEEKAKKVDEEIRNKYRTKNND